MKNAAEIHGFSRVSVRLELFFDEVRLAIGSGMIAMLLERPFLVTALHNFTGREPSGQIKSKTGGVPNLVRITGDSFQFVESLFHNENDPNADVPGFWIHPSGPKHDVTLLRVRTTSSLPLHRSFLDPFTSGGTIEAEIAQMCYVVGYPEGLFVDHGTTGVSPIWKTGHIASEPSLNIDGQNKVLIDAATCEGMSGAPVFLMKTGFPGQTLHRLLGIYTGRTSERSELGYVFTPETIWDVAEAGKPTQVLEYPRLSTAH